MGWRKNKQKVIGKLKSILLVLNLNKTCKICEEDVPIYKMFKIDGCSHHYCYRCMKRYIEFKVSNESNVPICPHENCHTKLNKIKRYRSFLSFKAMNLLEDRIVEDLVLDKVYCPYSDCSFLMSNMGTLNHPMRLCIKCHRYFCIECRVPWHNMSCEDYKKLYPATENPATENDMKLEVVALEKGWRKCPKCNHMIQRISGCKYVRCRCGGLFCYKCSNTSVTASGYLTCSCKLFER